MNKTLSATKARENFFQLISEANQPGHQITITVDGEAKIVMISADDFAGWQETLEIIQDKNLMKGIAIALNDLKKGKVITEKEFTKKYNLN